jgi:hypothetical protein
MANKLGATLEPGFIRPRKKIPVFPLTCSKILRSVGRKKRLNLFLASFYRGHFLTLIVLVQKWPKKLYGRHKKLRVGRVSGNTCNFFLLMVYFSGFTRPQIYFT